MTKRRPGRLPIKSAREPHYCAECGALIKKGDKMTMRMGGGYGYRVLCLKCSRVGQGEGQDNRMGKME